MRVGPWGRGRQEEVEREWGFGGRGRVGARPQGGAGAKYPPRKMKVFDAAFVRMERLARSGDMNGRKFHPWALFFGSPS